MTTNNTQPSPAQLAKISEIQRKLGDLINAAIAAYNEAKAKTGVNKYIEMDKAMGAQAYALKMIYKSLELFEMDQYPEIYKAQLEAIQTLTNSIKASTYVKPNTCKQGNQK